MTPRRLAIGAARAAIMTALAPIEKAQLSRHHGPGALPCFILGPPRSGTTLLYELMISRYRFAYLSNLAHRFYRTPVAATLLGRRGIWRWQGRFESRYGHIEGWAAPNEGGWIWNRWFPQESYLDATYADALPVTTIRDTVAAVSEVLDAPFLNKNVMHSVHMRLLDALFPGCLFVHLQRDAADNVRSILKARENERGPKPKDGWWSVKPREWHRYQQADHPVQAAAQVLHTHRDISADAAYLGQERRIVVDYADVCADACGTIDRIGEFLASHGVPVRVHGTIPSEFKPPSAKPARPEQLEPEIRAALQQVEADIQATTTGGAG